ncbi:POSSIBLE CONSERVED MEMBRANE PROTEIN [Alloactinosynnema sp. L-07]|uniref:DUF4229 domain-containing protein n=1 Tax=Alloactinosynnema sp. L-07 TaxID=1653480 RepID=UPI00065F016B|nr:DUF4229 domain-containing protein [Alloactinosynnema sp. L-07]CRK60176.1 POSSIBLE CONSERVED MEMBRANE PROTEIN [Alloactinosynnema sp. L-07]
MPSNVQDVQEHKHLGRDIALYTAARVAIVAAVTGALALFDIPLLVALAIGIVVGFPLGLLLFRGLNERVTAGLAERYADRDRLRAELRGDTEPDEEK